MEFKRRLALVVRILLDARLEHLQRLLLLLLQLVRMIFLRRRATRVILINQNEASSIP